MLIRKFDRLTVFLNRLLGYQANRVVRLQLCGTRMKFLCERFEFCNEFIRS